MPGVQTSVSRSAAAQADRGAAAGGGLRPCGGGKARRGQGTTSLGEQVILTRNEVHLHRERFPRNALAVVSLIELRQEAGAWLASGGELRFITHWEIEEDALRPLTFRYAVPDELVEEDDE
jgi:hypothetical protein